MKRCILTLLSIVLVLALSACSAPKDGQAETTNASADGVSVSEQGGVNKDSSPATTPKNKETVQKPSAQDKTVKQNSSAVGGKANNTNSDKERDRQFSAGNSAFLDINAAWQTTSKITDTIYDAWYWGLYESDKYDSYEECLPRFCAATGLDPDDVTNAIDNVLIWLEREPGDDNNRYMILQINSGPVRTTIEVYKANGWFDDIDDALKSAQKNISSMTKDYDDYTERKTLQLYYSEAFNYYNFALSPDCSFSTLESTVSAYETKLKNYNNQLAFTYLF